MPAAKPRPAAESAAKRVATAKPVPRPAEKAAKKPAEKPAKRVAAARPAPKPAKPAPDNLVTAQMIPTSAGVRCWLIKSEPTVYSIDTLASQGKTSWEGIRNYQCRNHMRDNMKIGEPVLFYHSNSEPSAVVGLATVASAPYPDPLQFDGKSGYHDPAATPDAPRWHMVDFAFVEKFPAPVGLDVLRADPALAGLLVASKGNRHSIQPVAPAHFLRITELARSTRARQLLGAP